jgi:hypothetical protein
MRRVPYLVIALAVLLTGCPAVPCWTPKEVPLQVLTFGGYGIACSGSENAKEARERNTADVAQCVRQGGDPAACRVAVYGTLAPQTNIGVHVYNR